MAGLVVTLRHTYPATVIPRGARKPRREDVVTRTSVTLPESSLGEMPVAAVADLVDRWDFNRPALPLRREEFRSTPEGLVSLLTGRNDMPVTRADLAGNDAPVTRWGDLFDTGATRGAIPEEELAARVRTVVESGALARAAELAEAAARCRVVGDAVYLPADEPVWCVVVGASHGPYDHVVVAPGGAEDGSRKDPCFRADDLDGALAYAAWRAEDHRATWGREARVRRDGEIRVLDASALRFDWAAANAGRLIDAVDRDQGGSEFAHLPLAALRAHVDFREALPAHRDGDRAATAACLSALRRLYDALPPEAGRGEARLDNSRAAPRLHKTLHSLRYLGPLLAEGLAAGPLAPEDEAALAF